MQVHDVKMQNEYNIRLKDAAMNDKVRELTEKYTDDMEQAEAKYTALQQDKEQQRAMYEEKLQDAAEHQQVCCIRATEMDVGEEDICMVHPKPRF